MADLLSVEEFWSRNLNGLKFLGSYPRSAREFWDASSLRYRYHDHLPPLFDRTARARPGGRLLEIGCGMGDDTAQWARRGMEVTAIDLTEPAVACTRERLDACGLEAEVRRGNAEALDFEDGRFDVVYSFGVLHHSPDTPAAIQEVWRVLRRGGVALVMLYHRRSLNFAVHRLLDHPFDGRRGDRCPVEHTYTRAQVREMFRGYSRCEIGVEYLFGTGYGVANRLMPRRVHRALGKWIGWHLMIEAEK